MKYVPISSFSLLSGYQTIVPEDQRADGSSRSHQLGNDGSTQLSLFEIFQCAPLLGIVVFGSTLDAAKETVQPALQPRIHFVSSSDPCPRTACLTALNGITWWASSLLFCSQDSSPQVPNEIELCAERTLDSLRSSYSLRISLEFCALVAPNNTIHSSKTSRSFAIKQPTAFCVAAITFLLLTAVRPSQSKPFRLVPPPPPISVETLIGILDPILMGSMVTTQNPVLADLSRFNNCCTDTALGHDVREAASLVACVLHLTTRLLHNDHILTNALSSNYLESVVDDPVDAKVHMPTKMHVWWFVGKRDRQRLEIIGLHWALSPCKAAAEGAAALLLMLHHTTPLHRISRGVVTATDESWCDGWHRVVVEEMVSLLTISSHAPDESSLQEYSRTAQGHRMTFPGAFGFLLLAETANHASSVSWVASTFNDSLNPKPFQSPQAGPSVPTVAAMREGQLPSQETQRTIDPIESKWRDQTVREPNLLPKLSLSKHDEGCYKHFVGVLFHAGIVASSLPLAMTNCSASNESSSGMWQALTSCCSLPWGLDWGVGLVLNEPAGTENTIHPTQLRFPVQVK
jgi:hypothetical protein